MDEIEDDLKHNRSRKVVEEDYFEPKMIKWMGEERKKRNNIQMRYLQSNMLVIN